MTDLIFSQINYDIIIGLLEDLHLAEIIKERANEEKIEVRREDLQMRIF